MGAQIWLADPDGILAPAADTKDRDRMVAAGWAPAGEPRPADRVWTRHGALGTYAHFVAEILPVWQARGWEPAAPPMAEGDLGPYVELPPAEPVAEVAPEITETAAEPSPKSKKEDSRA